MKRVYREALVPYSAMQMYDLVNDVPSYPTFLPWCKSARILTRTEHSMDAMLLLVKGGIHQAFTTRNSLLPYQEITMTLVDGPFKQLSGGWQFVTQKDSQTLVSVHLTFEFSSKILSFLLGAVFTEAVETLVSAFTKEAHRRYGHASH